LKIMEWLNAITTMGLCVACLLTATDIVCAHGMFHQIVKKEAVSITVEYDDGEPVSYADVKIHSPVAGKIEHQNGRTDKNGCFAFVPDLAGEWKIMIDGGMGHLINTTFVVGDVLNPEKKEKDGRIFTRWQGIVTGLSIIFGLSGFIYYFRARKLRIQAA